MKQCKDAIIYFFRQIAVYLVPVKGRGTIGMYQNIIVVSLWIESISICTAILICMHGSDNKWANFCQNTMIGIFCSAMLILVTTIIQFISERNKLFSTVCDDIVLFIACLADSLTDRVELTKKQYEIKFKSIKKVIDDSESIIDNDLIWFNVKTNDLYHKVCNDIVKLKIPFLTDRDPVDAIMSINKELTERVTINMKKMVDNRYNIYVEIFTELEQIITKQ